MSGLSQKELISELRARLEQETTEDSFSGAVLIARNGAPIFAEAYGLADRERVTRNTVKTRFRLGSITKMFTGVATLQLVEAGKVRLDDPLGKYLSDFPQKEVATKVAVEHLLNHTSGTGDIFGPEFDARRMQLRTLSDFAKLQEDKGLRFEPGTRWEYSNYGFILLGVLIEKVSGQTYYDYVRDHIYLPAQMWSSGAEPEDTFLPDRSIGYTRAAGTTFRPSTGLLPYLRPNTESLPYRGSSAGGGYSTVHDLLGFTNAVQQSKLLPPSLTEMLNTGKVETDHSTHYGYGFEHYTNNGAHWIGHTGGAIGMNGDLEFCPELGYTVVSLANLDPPSAGRIARFIITSLSIK